MRAIVTMTLALALAAGASAADSDDGALEANRARWSASGVEAYQYGYQKFCDCNRETPPETLVTVLDGRVVDVRHRPSGTTIEVPAAEDNFQYYWTVEELFSLIETGLSRDATVRADYDPELGFPRAIYIDYGPDHLSDVLDLRLTRLTREGG
jgi:hypothetical protein